MAQKVHILLNPSSIVRLEYDWIAPCKETAVQVIAFAGSLPLKYRRLKDVGQLVLFLLEVIEVGPLVACNVRRSTYTDFHVHVGYEELL